MDAITAQGLRIGDVVVDGDRELTVATLRLDERRVRARYVTPGAAFGREHAPDDVVFRIARELRFAS